VLAVWLQAQQEIPDWLESLAAGSHGSGGFTSNPSHFRDARRGNVGISFALTLYLRTCLCVSGGYHFLVAAMTVAGKSISKMTYFMSSGTFRVYSIIESGFGFTVNRHSDSLGKSNITVT